MEWKSMIYLSCIMGISCISLNSWSQEGPAELVTDRPDQTESSGVVPVRHLQIETGFLMSGDRTGQIELRSFAYNTTLLRYGLLENFELRAGLEYRNEKEKLLDMDEINAVSGFSPLYLGFKTRIKEEQGWIPEIAFLGGVSLPFTAQQEFRALHPAAIMRFAFSHTLSERFSLGYNLGAEWEAETGPGYFYTAALGIGLTEKLGMFVEAFGLFATDAENEHLADAGFTWLVLPNLQFDLSGGMGLNEAANDFFISAGLSYRIPH
jgi:hypothetical protein